MLVEVFAQTVLKIVKISDGILFYVDYLLKKLKTIDKKVTKLIQRGISTVYFGRKFKVKDPVSSVSTLALKRLLFDLKEKRSDICIRYRMLGKFWMPNFMHVISVGDRDVKLFDPITKISHDLIGLSDVVQFELDKKFQSFQPHYHYEVVWTPEF